MRDYSVRRTNSGYLVVNEKRLYELTDGGKKELEPEQWKACHTHINSRRIAMIIAESLEGYKVPNFDKVSSFTRLLLLKKCLRICNSEELLEAIGFRINIIKSRRKRRMMR